MPSLANQNESTATDSTQVDHQDNEASDTAHENNAANTSKKPGHGRMPHTVYTNAIEHQLQIEDLKSGGFCPTLCGGKLYDFE